MGKYQSFKRFGKTLPDLLSFEGWVLVFTVLTLISQNSYGCYRVIGRVARRPLRVGVQQVDDVIIPVAPPAVPRSKSLPNIVPKPKKPNPMDRDPSDAMNILQADASRRTKSQSLPSSLNSKNPIASPNSKSLPDLPNSRNSPALPTSKSLTMLSNSPSVPRGTQFRNQLRERVRNGGRSFLRGLGSFPLYSRRTMRNIHMRWRIFRMRHPAAVRYAKWVSWLGGIAASVGSAVSLPVELYRTFHTLNQSDEEIRTRIENVTAYLEELEEKSKKEFQDYPDETIYDLYHSPLKRDARGVYRLGFEDLPRSEEDPTVIDPTYQDIPGFPPEIEEAIQAMRTTTTTTTISTSTIIEDILQQPQRHTGQVNLLEKSFTLEDVSINATTSPSMTQETPMDWYGIWDRTTPRMLGWIILAMAGFIILLLYAAFVLCIRRCCVFIHTRMSSSTSSQSTNYPRALPLEPIELANVPLDNLNNVNFYEVIPVAQPAMAEPPAPAVPLSQ